MEGLRLGFVESGIDVCHKVVIFAMMDSNSLFLTGNTDTVYAATMLDLKASGPGRRRDSPEMRPRHR